MSGKSSFCILLGICIFLAGCASMGLPRLITSEMKDNKIDAYISVKPAMEDVFERDRSANDD